MSKRISRRTVLRGAGAALALPWLETMAPAAPAASRIHLSEPPLRMCSCTCRTACVPEHWTPAGDGEDYELTPHLKPLESLKNDFLLLENLWNAKTVGRNGHWPKVPAWLSGGYVEAHLGRRSRFRRHLGRPIAAQKIGDRTMLPSFELGLEATRTGIDTAGGGFARMYGSFISWRDPHTPVPKEIIPQLAFDRLFRTNKAPVISSLNPNDPSLLTSLQRDETSVLDLVREQAKSLRKEGSSGDRVRLDEYFESVRSVEQRLQARCARRSAGSIRASSRWNARPRHSGDAPGTHAPDDGHHGSGAVERHDAHRHLHDGDAQTNEDFSFLPGVKGGFHSISHHAEEPGPQEAV